ncbi:MAG: hypothetical protein JNL62_25680, partial [Bryobacterales bacterium]|nr:hypothetical protein [Bryobacterales bacterium]
EFPRTREYFRSRTGLTFDPLSAAESAAGITLGLILHPERAGRLVQYNARDAKNPGLAEVIDRVIGATWKRGSVAGLAAEVGRAVDNIALHQLMALALDGRASAQVRAVAMQKLDQLRLYAAGQKAAADANRRAHLAYAEMQIRKLMDDPKPANLPRLPEPPPGMPIGCAGPDSLGSAWLP